MIDGLIGGKLHGAPVERVGQSGKRFVTAKVRTPAGDGEAVFVNVITFSESVGNSLMTLDDGDSVSLAGAMTPKAWNDKNGVARPSLDMVAQAVLTAYHVARKRQSAASKGKIRESIDDANHQ
jgi:single-stranded DNA-binding protein